MRLTKKKQTTADKLKQYDAERSRLCDILNQIPFDRFKSNWEKYTVHLNGVQRNLLAAILKERIEDIDSEIKKLREEADNGR